MRELYGDALIKAIIATFRGIGARITDEDDIARKLEEMYINGVDMAIRQHPALRKNPYNNIGAIKMGAEHYMEEAFQIVWECLEQAFRDFDETAIVMAYLEHTGLL